MKLARALATIFAFTGTVCSSSAQSIQISKENKTIAIETSDEASALADTAIVSIGFESFGRDQNQTYTEASQTSNAIISALMASGIPKDALQSSDQNLRPLEPAGDQDKIRYAQGLRFQFTQNWRVTVASAAAAKVLQIAIASGANNSGAIDWQMKDDNELQSEAAKKALEHAHEIATSMAEGLHVKLGALVYASNQVPIRPFNGIVGTSSATVELDAVARLRTAPLAIAPDRITRSATVYAVFSIE